MPVTRDPEQPFQGGTRWISGDGQKFLTEEGLTPEAAEAKYLSYQQGPPTLGQTVNRGYQNIAGPVTNAVSQGIAGISKLEMAPTMNFGQYTPEQRQQMEQGIDEGAHVLAQHTVPQTPIEAGMMLGTGVAGASAKAAQLGRAAAMGTRMAGGMAGGEMGGQLSGEPTGKGALYGAVGTGVGEAVGLGQEAGRKVWANLTNALYTKDAKTIAASIHRLFPFLPEAKTTGELRDLVMSGTGQEAALKQLLGAYDGIKAKIQQANARKIDGVATAGTTDLYVPALGGRVSFDDARKALTEKFRTGYRQGQENPTPGTIASQKQKDDREMFQDILAQVTNDLNRIDRTGALAKEFVQERGQFRGAINTIDLLYRANGKMNRLFGPDAETFQTNRLQQVIGGDEAKWRKRLGKDAFETLAKDAFRGAKVGRGDTEGISLGTLVGKSNTGLSGGAFFSRMPQISIPNYTGSPKPFVMSPAEQTLLDLILQSGLMQTGAAPTGATMAGDAAMRGAEWLGGLMP